MKQRVPTCPVPVGGQKTRGKRTGLLRARLPNATCPVPRIPSRCRRVGPTGSPVTRNSSPVHKMGREISPVPFVSRPNQSRPAPSDHSPEGARFDSPGRSAAQAWGPRDPIASTQPQRGVTTPARQPVFSPRVHTVGSGNSIPSRFCRRELPGIFLLPCVKKGSPPRRGSFFCPRRGSLPRRPTPDRANLSPTRVPMRMSVRTGFLNDQATKITKDGGERAPGASDPSPPRGATISAVALDERAVNALAPRAQSQPRSRKAHPSFSHKISIRPRSVWWNFGLASVW